MNFNKMTNVLMTGNVTVQGTASISTLGNVKCAVLSETQPTGTFGGQPTLGWQNRTLNTLIDPFNIVTLDSGNVTFTLNETGNYYFDGSAPAYRAEDHQLILIESGGAGAIKIRGSSTYTDRDVAIDQNRSYVQGIVTVTSTSQAYKFYHNFSVATSQLIGRAVNTNMGLDELFSMLTIIKLSD